MNADSIKNALTRKFGPLPAWAWFGIAAVGVWWYRRHTTGAAASTADQSAGTGFYGPYSQGEYPITGGAGTGGGGSPDTQNPPVPKITVNFPGRKGKRDQKGKDAHKVKNKDRGDRPKGGGWSQKRKKKSIDVISKPARSGATIQGNGRGSGGVGIKNTAHIRGNNVLNDSRSTTRRPKQVGSSQPQHLEGHTHSTTTSRLVGNSHPKVQRRRTKR